MSYVKFNVTFHWQGMDKHIIDDTEEARQNFALYPRPLNVLLC